MARLVFITVLLVGFSSVASAYTVAGYVDAKEAAANGDRGNQMALGTYHQGIAETVQTILSASPRGKILGEGYSICLNEGAVNRQLVEDVIARNLPDDLREVKNVSPTVVFWLGLVKMAPCD